MVFIHYIRILSSVTMPMCDVLLRHFRKMLLYTQGYAVAYSHLLSTLAGIHVQVVACLCICVVGYTLYICTVCAYVCTHQVSGIRETYFTWGDP